MHLSDLHINMTRISAERIKKAVKAEKPDLILITGDYINKPVHASEFLRYLRTFTRGCRTIMCLGNHEYKAFRSNKEGLQNFIREIEALGVEVLINRTVVVEKDGQKYNIIGFDDLRRGSPDIEKAMEMHPQCTENLDYTQPRPGAEHPRENCRLHVRRPLSRRADMDALQPGVHDPAR